jgi:hypothetical protein
LADSRFAGKGNTLYASRQMKVLNAQRRGAIAVLIAPEPRRRHPTAQELRDRIGHQADHAANPIPSQALLDGVLKIPSLLITDSVAERILAPLGRPSDLQSKIDGDLTARSAPLPGSVVTLTLRVGARREATAWNVAGLIEGTDPTLAPETIIIAAHHDHDGQSDGKIWAGADDNASGVAGVVALARAFAAQPARPRRSLLFIAFAAEERGLLGAQHYTEHPLRPLATTRAVINFDMIGRNEEASPHTDGLIDVPSDTSLRLNLVGATYSRDYLGVLKAENRRVGLVLDDRFDREPALNTLFRSDQFPFLMHGVPAVWWFTGFHKDYHHPTDTAEKINYAKMALILRLAYLSASRFARDEKPPQLSAPAAPTRNSACEIAAAR